jgi:hypothetical protein
MQPPGRYLSHVMNDEAFLQAFETRTFPFDQWHHDAHIKVAYLYLRRHPLKEAIEKMRAGIKAYNAAHKVPEGPDRGYHDTVTVAWLRLVHLTLCEYGPAESAACFYEQHPELSQKKVLRLFYSRGLIMSPQAKAAFVEPDLAPLPRSANGWKGSPNT